MPDEIKIIRMKRGTSTEWGSEAAPLMAGELGYDSTLGIYKGGDGSTAFGSLPTLTTTSGTDPSATDTAEGLVELATSAETVTAEDATRAVTPAGFLAGLRGNLLGTVSQAEGTPTGGVIERGSNANGEYAKFADGTMLCTFNAALSAGSYEWTYPAAFASSPQVACLPTASDSADLFSAACQSAPGTSSAVLCGNVSTDSGASWGASTAGIRIAAVGRWFQMRFVFSPQRRDDVPTLAVSGDILVVNGADYDFTPLTDGGTLPRGAIGCEWICGDVERVNGELIVPVILPHGGNASSAARFPEPITVTDGQVVLPA